MDIISFNIKLFVKIDTTIKYLHSMSIAIESKIKGQFHIWRTCVKYVHTQVIQTPGLCWNISKHTILPTEGLCSELRHFVSVARHDVGCCVWRISSLPLSSVLPMGKSSSWKWVLWVLMLRGQHCPGQWFSNFLAQGTLMNISLHPWHP